MGNKKTRRADGSGVVRVLNQPQQPRASASASGWFLVWRAAPVALARAGVPRISFRPFNTGLPFRAEGTPQSRGGLSPGRSGLGIAPPCSIKPLQGGWRRRGSFGMQMRIGGGYARKPTHVHTKAAAMAHPRAMENPCRFVLGEMRGCTGGPMVLYNNTSDVYTRCVPGSGCISLCYKLLYL